jgi:hypothetical protein
VLRGQRDCGDAKALGEIVCQLIKGRKLVIARESTPKPAILITERGVLIPRVLPDLLGRMAKGLEPTRIPAVLANEGVLLNENARGWLVTNAWWAQFKTP